MSVAVVSTWVGFEVGLIRDGLVEAQQQGTLPSGMTNFVNTGGEQVTAATGAVWPLFFNTLVNQSLSMDRARPRRPRHVKSCQHSTAMGTEESRARNEWKVVGDDADPMSSVGMDGSRYRNCDPAGELRGPILTCCRRPGAMFWRASPVIYVKGKEGMGATLLELGSWQLSAAKRSLSVLIGGVRSFWPRSPRSSSASCCFAGRATSRRTTTRLMR